jgi:hypothetical protein
MTTARPQPWIEVNVTHKSIQRMATISQQWQRSYLYAPSPKRVVLSRFERSDLDESFIGVVGPLGYTDMKNFLTEELQ